MRCDDKERETNKDMIILSVSVLRVDCLSIDVCFECHECKWSNSLAGVSAMTCLEGSNGRVPVCVCVCAC